ncbi:MAG: lysophospholipase L1-like esterase [Chlamydiales bacterium]|jgi:lysophospholipase L1-like esterase
MGEIMNVLLIAAGSALAAFVAAEWLARLWLRTRERYWVWTPYRRIHMEIDRETLPSLEPLVRFEINRDGERGDEPPAAGPNTYRALIVGGSAAECYLLDQESTWPAVVQSLLREPENLERLEHTQVHVGSAARSLVPCWYIQRMLARTLPRIQKLDVAILMVGASDLVGWLEKKGPAVVEHGGLPTSSYFGQHPEGPFGWTLRSLALRKLVGRVQQRFLRPIERRERTGKKIADNRAMRARAQELLDTYPDPKPMLEAYARDLRRVIDLLRTRAGRVLVVGQPWFDKEFDAAEKAVMWNFGAGRPYDGEVSVYYTHRVASELMGQVDAVTASVARDAGVEHLDLMPILERNLETYYDFFHFTPKGARAVGASVAQALIADHPSRPDH